MKRKIGLASLALLLIAAMCMPVSAWSANTHQDSAFIAMNHGGSSGLASTAKYAADDPDSWAGDFLFHGGSQAGTRANQYAITAKALYAVNHNDQNWAKNYGYATHYMTDQSMPWHSNALFWPDRGDQSGHDKLEILVANNLHPEVYAAMDSAGSNFVVTPGATCDAEGTYSSGYTTFFIAQMVANPSGWQDDYYVKATLRNLLSDATANNRGMLAWVKG